MSQPWIIPIPTPDPGIFILYLNPPEEMHPKSKPVPSSENDFFAKALDID
jgi:hypothetical protein